MAPWKIKFHSVTPIDNAGRNKIFIGRVGSKKFLIKQYVKHPLFEKSYKENRTCELLCYQMLPWKHIPTFVKGSVSKRYLITEYVPGKQLQWSNDTINLVIAMFEEDILQTDASFLPKSRYDHVIPNLINRAKELEKNGVIKRAEMFQRLLQDNRAQLMASAKYFSHGDPRDGNLLISRGKVYVIDFEKSRRDNYHYDLVAIYIDLRNYGLQQYFFAVISGKPYFDENLFRIMMLKRCIDMMYSFFHRELTHLDVYAQAVLFFNSIAEGKDPWKI